MLSTTITPHPSDRLFRGEASSFPEALALRISAIDREIKLAESCQPISQMSRQNLIGLLWQYREAKLCEILLRQYKASTNLDTLLAQWRQSAQTRWYAKIAQSGNFKEFAI